jgi:hypothetical protein
MIDDVWYVSADEYVRRAKCGFSGKTLQRWCDQNPFFADAIGEIKTPGTRRYDLRTAPHFRKLWIGAQQALRERGLGNVTLGE